MDLIADIFLAAGAIGAAVYCFVLGRRLNRFNDLKKGVGGAVAVLSAQVDDLTRTLTAAQKTAAVSADTLTALTSRAEEISRTLELQMASLHDIAPSEELHKPAAAGTEKRPAMKAAPAERQQAQPAENAAPVTVPREGAPMFARRVPRTNVQTGDAA